MNFEHFTLKAITLKEASDFFQLVENNRKRISTYFPGIVTVTRTLKDTILHIKQSIEGEKKGKYTIYLIIDNTTNEAIGVVQMKDIDPNAMKRELGFFIDENYEGKGITTKAVKAAAQYCFDILHLNKVFLRIAKKNIASRRVAEKCGFKTEGILRNDFRIVNGKLIDMVYYGLLKEEMK